MITDVYLIGTDRSGGPDFNLKISPNYPKTAFVDFVIKIYNV